MDSFATGSASENLNPRRRCTSTTSGSRSSALFEEIRARGRAPPCCPGRRRSLRRAARLRRRGERASARSACSRRARPVGAQIVFSSTGGAIYGERTSPAPEDDAARAPLRRTAPRSSAAEEYLATYNRTLRDEACRRSGSATSTARGRIRTGEAGVVSIFLGPASVRRGHRRSSATAEQTRDFVYVGDVVARGARRGSGRPGGVFNIGTGIETSVNELFDGLPATVAGVEVRGGACAGSRRRAAAERARSESRVQAGLGLAAARRPRRRAPRDLALR